ncbi:MAG: hypothetical protein HFG69_10855 [Hungatella sp.]|nr:hypothetical protein [Hungatella sp.]
MKEKEKMPRLERQLRLYEVICRYAIAQFSNICEAFPYNKRLLQRDLADLREAGLVSVKYSRKGKGYFVTGIPEFNEKAAPCKKAHLKRLNRLGRLMSGLENADIPLWEKKDNAADGDVREYFTAKDSYNRMFPGLSERTRQRDFEMLRNMGYQVFYDPVDHCFSWDEDSFVLVCRPLREEIDDDFVDGTW